MQLSASSRFFSTLCGAGICLFTLVSHAGAVVGNPTTGIVGVGSGSVYVDSVLAKPCTGSNLTIVVDASVSNSATVDLNLGQETWCHLYVDVKWTPSSSITQVLVTGFTTYQTLNGEDDWVIQLDGSAGTATLISDTGKS
jgi:hypothetical protein